jgi:hypothetical protein
LAEEERDVSDIGGRLNQLVNNSTKQHRLTFTKIALNPE